MQSKFVADDILIVFDCFFLFFFQKIYLGISCESSARQTIHMKYQALFIPKIGKKKQKYVVCCCIKRTGLHLTLVMLNKLRCHAYFQFSAYQITRSRLLIYNHTLNDKTVQIQITWLLQKPTDLDLHCLKGKVYPGSAGQVLKIYSGPIYSWKVDESKAVQMHAKMHIAAAQ